MIELVQSFFEFIILIILCFFLFPYKIWVTEAASPLTTEKLIVKCLALYVCLFVYVFFRNINIGTDAYEYMELYNYIQINEELPSYLFNKEIGYAYLNLFSSQLGLSFQFFSSLYISISIIITLSCLKKYYNVITPFLFFIVASGFVLWLSNGMRQALAISLIFISFFYIPERKWVLFLFIISIACLFHKSALFMLPVYFVYKLGFRSLVYILILSVIYKLSGFNLLSSTAISDALSIVPGMNEYAHYLYSDKMNLDQSGSGVVYLTKLIFFTILSMCLFYRDRLDEITVIHLKIGSIYYIVYNILGDSELINRLLQYFNYSVFFIMALFIAKSETRYEKAISILLVLLYISVFFINDIKLLSTEFHYR